MKFYFNWLHIFISNPKLVSSSKDLDEDLIAVNAQNIPEVTEDQQQRVNQLMEEAMQDCFRDTPKRKFHFGFHSKICCFVSKFDF